MKLPKLNLDGRPIVYNYYEGKMKRTLKRSEIVEKNAVKTDKRGYSINVGQYSC